MEKCIIAKVLKPQPSGLYQKAKICGTNQYVPLTHLISIKELEEVN